MSLKNLNATIKIPKLLSNKFNVKKIRSIYKKFENSFDIKENFAVAVSGGPDSLALAFLAKIYSIKWRLNVKFLIVNHKLRSESTNEAKTVKKVLKKNLISSEILTWNGRKPSKNIQSIARIKRYELLLNKCKKHKIKNILLGHHQDDLFENFFIRLLRGSGLKGLISLDRKTKVEDITLFRPLLNHKKEDLIFLTKKVFNYYAQDPSNLDLKYQRIKIRQLIKDLENNGLDKSKFLKTINNLKYSNEVVGFYVNENLKKNSKYLEKPRRIILRNSFFQQPYEIVFRAFSDLLKKIGKKYYSVRGKKIDKVINEIEKNHSYKVTLGGCIIEKVNQTVIISKEH